MFHPFCIIFTCGLFQRIDGDSIRKREKALAKQTPMFWFYFYHHSSALAEPTLSFRLNSPNRQRNHSMSTIAIVCRFKKLHLKPPHGIFTRQFDHLPPFAFHPDSFLTPLCSLRTFLHFIYYPDTGIIHTGVLVFVRFFFLSPSLWSTQYLSCPQLWNDRRWIYLNRKYTHVIRCIWLNL